MYPISVFIWRCDPVITSTARTTAVTSVITRPGANAERRHGPASATPVSSPANPSTVQIRMGVALPARHHGSSPARNDAPGAAPPSSAITRVPPRIRARELRSSPSRRNASAAIPYRTSCAANSTQ
ncbi:hypothetical protein D0T12_00715 [Actinomadura spongiicola]|uniref:Uncharacterized protein n=1 Tax=Actinomadura spongiicola TaxID=2303421 RepID=A0A372GN70_9ACTN|nr:hypothetical protein D0T12_00715 [Actinomadura spongiicola]